MARRAALVFAILWILILAGSPKAASARACPTAPAKLSSIVKTPFPDGATQRGEPTETEPIASRRIAAPPGIDWASFLGRLDPVWDRLPLIWYDAPFLGNGELGTLVRRTGDREVRWDVGNSLVHDHRGPDDYSVRSPEILNRGRLPIGHFLMKTAGMILGGTARLDLWNAEARGTIETDRGAIDWRALVHAEDMIIAVDWAGTGGEADSRLTFVPEKAESPRFTANKASLPAAFVKAYAPNPEPAMRDLGGGIMSCEQPLVAGGMTTTAWTITESAGRGTLLATCRHTFPERNASDLARAELRRAAATDRAAWLERHRRWWHAYYPASFIATGDPVWDSFYWIQMYKLACATRPGRALIDNQGPWLQPTGWNGAWWNLNVQLSYSAVAAANRLDLGEALTGRLKAFFPTLIENVDPAYRADSAGLSRNTSLLDLKGKAGKPGGWEHPNPDIGGEVGNLAWTCHSVYTLYRSGMDDALLKDVLYPLLKRAMAYYKHFLKPGPDGRLHLAATHSPEYGNVPDANYDLGLIHWGNATLIELAGHLKADADLIPVWRDTLNELAAFPVNDNGLMVGAGAGFDKTHRHWSHMLMVYPLRVLTPENGNTDLIRRSLDRWHSLPGDLAGFSVTAGASIAALLGDGERAKRLLDGFKPYMGASTMYYEGGKAALPVMETPLHGASVVQEMLLQSWGGRIRVFPAVPAAWPEAVFTGLRAEGAFLVDAVRRGGRTAWIRIRSLKGEPCLLRTDLVDPRVASERSAGALQSLGNDLYEIRLAAGEEIVLAAKGYSGPFEAPTPAYAPGPAPFGLK